MGRFRTKTSTRGSDRVSLLDQEDGSDTANGRDRSDATFTESSFLVQMEAAVDLLRLKIGQCSQAIMSGEAPSMSMRPMRYLKSVFTPAFSVVFVVMLVSLYLHHRRNAAFGDMDAVTSSSTSSSQHRAPKSLTYKLDAAYGMKSLVIVHRIHPSPQIHASSCRIFHSCVLPDGRLLLPLWMKRHQNFLETECGVENPSFVLLDASTLRMVNVTDFDRERFALLDLDYEDRNLDLLGSTAPRFSRMAFVMDILYRTVFAELIIAFHDQEPVRFSKHQCYDASLGQEEDCYFVGSCGIHESDASEDPQGATSLPFGNMTENLSLGLFPAKSSSATAAGSSSLSMLFRNPSCPLGSRFSFAVLESTMMSRASELTWQKQFWVRLQDSWRLGRSVWHASKNDDLFSQASPASAVCYRSISTAQATEPESYGHFLKLGDGKLRTLIVDAFGLNRISRNLEVKMYEDESQPYCRVNVVVMVRKHNSLMHDQDMASPYIEGSPFDEAGVIHDIPEAHSLRQVLDHQLEKAKLWSVKFNLRIIRFDLLTLDEQIRVMQETDILIGAHGAQMSNIIFMPRFSTVIEVYPFGCFADSARALASSVKVRHFSIISAPDPDAFLECIQDHNPADSAAAATVLRAYNDAAVLHRVHGTPVDLKLDAPRMYHANGVAFCAHSQRLAFDFNAVAQTSVSEAIRQCQITLGG